MKVRLTMNDGSVREIGEVYKMEEAGVTLEESSRELGFPEWFARFQEENYPWAEKGKDKGRPVCRRCSEVVDDYRHMRVHGWTVPDVVMPPPPEPPWIAKPDGVFEDGDG